MSNFGGVRSVARCLTRKNGRTFHYFGKELKQNPNSKGYMRVPLSDRGGHKKRHFVHRLVADAFECPGNGDVVNHKDFNPLNNHADNLEYTTIYGNYAYSANRGRYVRTEEWLSRLKRTLDSKFAKPVIGENITTGEIIRFSALNDCKNAGFQPSVRKRRQRRYLRRSRKQSGRATAGAASSAFAPEIRGVITSHARRAGLESSRTL